MLENEKPKELVALLDVARDTTTSGTSTVNVLRASRFPILKC